MREGREEGGKRGGREERREEESEGEKRGGKKRVREGREETDWTLPTSETPDILECALTSRGSEQCAVRRWLWSAAVPPLLTSHNTHVSETVHSTMS